MRNLKIHLITHGRIQQEVDGRYIGRTDVPLCAEGKREVAEYAETLTYPPAELVYMAAQMRTKETAAILYPDRQQIAVPELNEMDFGIFENRSAADLRGVDAYFQWIGSGTMDAPPEGESSAAFKKRTGAGFQAVVEDLFRKKAGAAALVVSASVLKSIIRQFSKDQFEDLLLWSIPAGTGYTALVNPQLWMNGKIIELYEGIPYRLSDEVDYKKMYFGEE